jgi:predicted nuclease of restriction endonuclease-like RecB superfamily
LGSSFSIARAKQPLQARGATLFPDFTFERGNDRVLVEIIGFHTSAYLKAKLDALKSEGFTSVLLCVDDTLACSERSAIEDPSVFRFHRRIEVGRLLRSLETLAATGDPAPDSDQRSH